jgi:hypothetical protein
MPVGDGGGQRMEGGLGGGNGFMFRTRRQEDAEAFAQELRSERRPERPSRATVAVVVGVLTIVAILGLADWLG